MLRKKNQRITDQVEFVSINSVALNGVISIKEPRIKLYFSIIGNSIKDGKAKLLK